MGTRARIAVANPDGTFNSIYTHWDGYPSHHGPILLEHYNTVDAVRELIALGDLSSLDTTIETCSAYGRDRGETDVGAVTSNDIDKLRQLTQDCGGEYLYLFDGSWSVAEGGVAMFGLPASEAPAGFQPLSATDLR